MGYTYYKPVTIDHDKIDANLANFPVLFKSTIDELKSVGNGGHVQSSDGFDIIFSSDKYGGVTLPHEIIHYVETTGEFIAHVKIPAISSSADTVYYMLYGNTAISTSQEDITDVWDANFMSVWHLYQPSGDYLDSTSNARELDNITVTARNATGKIYLCPTFDGTDDEVYGAMGSYTLSDCLCEAFIQGEDEVNGWQDFSIGLASSGMVYRFWRHGTNLMFGRFLDWSTNKRAWTLTSVINNSTWYYCAAAHVNDSDSADLWINDSKTTINPATEESGAGAHPTAVVTHYSSRTGGSGSEPFEGNIEEVRVSNSIRSDSWIKATYYTLADPATFYGVGDEGNTRTPRHPIHAMPLIMV